MIDSISTDIITRVLDANNGYPTIGLIDSIVINYKTELNRLKGLYDRFRAEGLPITGKSVQNPEWSNTKLRTNIEGHIVRLFTGFMNPYATSYAFPSKPEFQSINDALSKWTKANTIEKIDSETFEKSCSCGMSYLYVDQGDQKVYNLNPYEVIPVWSITPDRLDFALRYYVINAYVVKDDGTLTQEQIEKFEWYGPNKIIFYERNISQEVNGGIKLIKEVENMIGICPVVMVRFNGSMSGNYSDVTEMCDAYREVLSTFVDEGINIKWAILKFLGMNQPDSVQKDANGDTEESRFVRMLKRAFSIFIPNVSGQTGTVDVQWLSKQLPKDVIEFLLGKLYEQILIQTETFDPDSSNSSSIISNTTGPGMDFKLLSMTSKCQMAKTYFICGMREVIRLVIAAWNIKGNSSIDPYDVDIIMNFNKPIDRLTEIQFLAQGKGILSQKTLLSNSLLVKDVNTEIEQMKQEQEESRQFYTYLDEPQAPDTMMTPEEITAQEADKNV
jgi:SPP1 family phage portal protein